MGKKLWPLIIGGFGGIVCFAILNYIDSTLLWVAFFLVVLNFLSVAVLYCIIDSNFQTKRGLM